MPLPQKDLTSILSASNELAVDIEFVVEGGNIAARAYVFREHADGYDVDVNATKLTLPESSIPDERSGMISSSTPERRGALAR